MSVFWVHTTAQAKAGTPIVLIFEHPAGSVEELSELLAEKIILSGSRLLVTDDGRGGKLVRGRVPTALTIRGVAMIQPYEYRVWEPEEAAA